MRVDDPDTVLVPAPPRCGPDAAPVTAPAASPPVAAARTLRLIVVEDEPAIAQIIKDAVEDLGHTVCGIARTEQEAVDLADRERPELALMDVRLAGGGDGIVAARRLAAGFGIRSVFLSGYADHATMRRLTETYPLGVVHKPFSLAQLKTALDLAGRRLRARG
ncbi:response regulator [Azospirillum sp. TSO22-1]|uniref:response regulator n=1 Tax=Azospirillum sp. TSO22-1 TaxID=716789 RepID=UPI00200030B5|nr:response regulator [Azospirillum sp. TSO22-1]